MARKAIPERILAMAEGLFEAMDSGGIGISVIAEDGERLDRLYHNPALGRIFGYQADELDDVPVMLPLVEEEQERIAKFHQRMRAGEEVEQSLTTRLRRPDGTVVPIEVVFARTEVDGRQVNIAFVRDISSERSMAEELAASERRFRTLIETAPDAVVVSRSGTVLYANPAAHDMLRVSPGGLVGRHLSDFMASSDVARMVERTERVLAGERLEPEPYIGLRSDGSEFKVEIKSSAIEWEGQPAVIGFGRDVSAREAMQSELIEADRMASVGLLAAGVAHEINNPLTYTLLHLARLKRVMPSLATDAETRAGVERMLAEAIEGGDRVGTIVRDLLTFVRGSHEGSEASVSVTKVIEAAVGLAQTAIDPGATVERHLEAVRPVCGNEARLGQVFVNLIVNALQAMADRPISERTLEVVVAGDDGGARVEISDRGGGIDPEIADRIFDPFFTTKELGVGTGLGLSISRSILDGMGGTIQATSRPGGGTTFVVRLPYARRTTPERITQPQGPGIRARLLLVDDDPLVLDAVASALGERYEVDCLRTGREAVERIMSDEVLDVVLCDLSMPAFDGIDVFEAVSRERPAFADRILFVTGGARTERQRQFAAEHRERILSKPLDLEQVFALIDARVRGRALG